MDRIRLIDELALNAWPAPVCQHSEGWVLRYGWGATRRANSAWPGAAVPADLDALIADVVRAYRGWDAPARVQVTDGLVPGLDERLGELGWTVEGASHFMAADLDAVIAATPAAELEVAPSPDSEWIGAWWSAGRHGEPPAAAERIVGLPLPAAGHGRTRTAEGQWTCVGRAVCERGWAGLFAIATHPDHRGQGHATALIGGLARWARAAGARRAYLQVEVDNERARRLFTRLSFTRVGGYHYRTLPYHYRTLTSHDRTLPR